MGKIIEEQIIQKHFLEFQSIINETFPDGRRDYTHLKKYMDTLRQLSFYEEDIMCLIDHKRHRTIYVSDNFEALTGISRETFLAWKGMYMFRLLVPAHFSFPFRTVSKGLKFFKEIPVDERKYLKRFAAGMKIYDGNRKIRRIFSKSKILTLDENQNLDVSIFFIKDISHLVNGDGYWVRHASKNYQNCFVKQKGKQHFDDLLSKRELEIVALLAEHYTSNEIADKLFLAVGTVEKHRKNMLKRTGAVNTTALVHLCKLAEVLK